MGSMQAEAAGYRALERASRIGGGAPISGADLRSRQDFARQQSNLANLIGSTDYLAQIQQVPEPAAEWRRSGGKRNGNVKPGHEARLQASSMTRIRSATATPTKFRFNQGQPGRDAARRRRACRQRNTLAALAQYGQGMASDEYGNEVGQQGAFGQRDSNLGLKGV